MERDGSQLVRKSSYRNELVKAIEKKPPFLTTGMFRIDGKSYALQEITFAQLHVRYETGRSFPISGTGRDRKYGYRTGCMTELGDIELSEWMELVRCLIERKGEQQLQENLLSWVKENCPWLHTQTEQETYSLSLHASRIFDCREWVDYTAFNKQYRPEILQGKKEGETQVECE